MLQMNLRLAPVDLAYVADHAETSIVLVDESLLPVAEALVEQGVGVKTWVVMTDKPLSEISTTLPGVVHWEDALTAAESVLIPIQCEYYALEGVGQLINTVKLMRKKLNPALAIEGILLTMFDSRTNLCAQVVQEVRSHFPEEVFETMIPRNVRLSEAPSYGVPIHLYDARSTGAQAYRALSRELIERNEG